MTAAAGGPAQPDEPTRERPAGRPPADRARRAGGGIGAAWRALTPEQRLAAIAAIALLLSMLLPWYQETGFAVVRNRGVRLADSKNAFQVYSFVEAAVFVVSAGVLALLYARGHRRAFHLPGGDGAVIMAAGFWVMFLVFYRQLDKPDGRHEGPINTSIGVEWGIFVAFLLGALLAFAGFRIRQSHVPEPGPGDTAPPPAPERERDRSSWLDEHDDEPTTTRAPRTERTTVAQPPRPSRTSGEGSAVDDDLDVDEPAEYRPPPRKR
jgi:hypothetical protein